MLLATVKKKLSEIPEKACEAVAHILFAAVLTGYGTTIELNLFIWFFIIYLLFKLHTQIHRMFMAAH